MCYLELHQHFIFCLHCPTRCTWWLDSKASQLELRASGVLAARLVHFHVDRLCLAMDRQLSMDSHRAVRSAVNAGGLEADLVEPFAVEHVIAVHFLLHFSALIRRKVRVEHRQ